MKSMMKKNDASNENSQEDESPEPKKRGRKPKKKETVEPDGVDVMLQPKKRGRPKKINEEITSQEKIDDMNSQDIKQTIQDTPSEHVKNEYHKEVFIIDEIALIDTQNESKDN